MTTHAPSHLPAPPTVSRGPSTRVLVAVAVLLLGLLGAAAWGILAIMDVASMDEGFARTGTPGAVVVTLDGGAEAVVYVEDVPASVLRRTDLTVTGPDGTAVPVHPVGAELVYDTATSTGTAVASFSADLPGAYAVSTAADLGPTAVLAVGPDLRGALVPAVLGPSVVALAFLVLALVIALAPPRHAGTSVRPAGLRRTPR